MLSAHMSYLLRDIIMPASYGKWYVEKEGFLSERWFLEISSTLS